MPYSNTQEDNFHFYIDFSYSHKIHYHMYACIFLVYDSTDHECHKIPRTVCSLVLKKLKQNIHLTMTNYNLTSNCKCFVSFASGILILLKMWLLMDSRMIWFSLHSLGQ